MNSTSAHRPTTTRQGLALMRWWLLGGLALAVLAAPTLLDIPLPWQPLLAVLLLLAGLNLRAARQDERSDAGLARQLVIDLTGLGVMFYLTGGATNPLVSLLLLPVTVAALSLPRCWAAGVAAYAIAVYSFLMLFSLPLAIADAARATRLHLAGMWLTFVVSAALLAWLVARMTEAARARDAQLAAVREEALRDAQVVALGQQAAGAAHELGTPLATMKILAGELAQDARLPDDARADLQLLQQQIDVCKTLIGDLARRAGVGRAEAPPVPADRWLDALLGRWRSLWPQADCQLERRGAGAVPLLAAEPTLEQALTNLLNNAARQAPQGLRLLLDWDDAVLRIAVQDRGPGFPAVILAAAGRQPQAGQPEGMGLGLWLTRAAIERRGGRLRLENNAAGGRATLELPRDSFKEAI